MEVIDVEANDNIENDLRNIGTDSSKSTRKQGSAAVKKFNSYLAVDYGHLQFEGPLNYSDLRLVDLRIIATQGLAYIYDIFCRYCKFAGLSLKSADLYLSQMTSLFTAESDFLFITFIFDSS